MKLLNKYALTGALMAAIGLTPLAVQAESNKVTGSGILSTTAKLNLRVTIPEFLYFRVGTDATGSVDTIEFAPSTAVLGDGSSISGTGGDAVAGTGANVRVSSNSGEITITETNNGGGSGLLGTGTNSISLSEITVTSDDANLDTPILSDAGGNFKKASLNGGAVTNRNAIWTYAYNNTTVPDADTYDVEITYTAVTL